MRTLSLLSALTCGLALVASAVPASAQSASDKAAAQALFDDAQKLAGTGDWASACPKYSESNRLDPGIGVKLYLGDCYEHVGKTASAWAMFGEAEEYARKQGDGRATVAHQRAEKLAPRLIRLRLAVPAPSPGMVVHRDGEEVGAGQWGVAVPVDPGPHTIEATAPGKSAWSQTVDAKEGAAGPVEVQVPALQDAPAAAPPSGATPDGATPPAQGSSNGNTQRILAVVAAGVGVVGVGVGTAFGLSAKSKLDDSNSGHCHDGNLCDAAGVQLRSDAKSNALGSTIAFVVGGVGLAGGAVLWFTAPKSGPSVGLSPVVTERYAGLRLGGAF